MSENVPVVIDNGSCSIKAGYAGETSPQCIIPTLVGHKGNETVVGEDAVQAQLQLSRPISRGLVRDWEDMYQVWRSVYDRLGGSAKQRPVLLSDTPFCPFPDREKIAQFFLEELGVPGLAFCTQGVLGLYAVDKTTGIVLDCGDGLTQCVPVFEGVVLRRAVSCLDVGGQDVTNYLALLLRKGGHTFHSVAEREIVREIKESVCYVSKNPLAEERALGLPGAASTAITHSLPDGQKISLEAERFRAPEILFRPSLLGSEYLGVHELIAESIERSDMGTQPLLYSNVVLSGGSTQFLGFGDRLLSSLHNLAPKDMKIRIYSPPERQHQTWSGGSILASHSAFRDLVISKAKFLEDPELIHGAHSHRKPKAAADKKETEKPIIKKC